MKPYLLLVFMIMIVVQPTLSQDKESLESSTIHFVRSGAFVASACKSIINLPNQKDITLSLKSMVNYTIYSSGKIRVTADAICPNGGGTAKQVTLNVESGEDYYVFWHTGNFKKVEKSDIKRHIRRASGNIMTYEENIQNPVNPGSIAKQKKKDTPGQGTGFLLNQEGYVITNFHVIENAKKIMVKGLKGDYNTSIEATKVAVDRRNDLALLQITSELIDFDSVPYSFASSSQVNQGQDVFALGYPAQNVMGSEIKVTDGIISSKSGYKGSISEFQFSAPVQPGNSGGPLFTKNGEFIGVVTAKISADNVENVGYAIKSDYLKLFLNQSAEDFQYHTKNRTTEGKELHQLIETFSNYVYIIETE